MRVFNVHKIFRLGRKAGKKSVSPCVVITCNNLLEARKIWSTHPKRKDNTEYTIMDGGPAVLDDLMKSADQQGPEELNHEWAVGDHCWLQLEPLNVSYPEPYFRGKIYEIRQGETERYAVIWVEGDYASWRYRGLSGLLTRPPRGQAARGALSFREEHSED